MSYSRKHYLDLREKYKKFFEKMPWGFECGSGWYKIIERLTEDICKIIEKDKLEDVYALYVQEKYGTLRFNISSATDEIYDLIEKAEDASENTCEICGEPGELIGESWFKVRCDKCD